MKPRPTLSWKPSTPDTRPFNLKKTSTNNALPFLGMELLKNGSQIETKVYVNPTNSGLLLHYQSHVDFWYKRALIKTMLN